MIAICVSVKNRSLNLKNYLIDSMNQCNDKQDIILSVFDFGSTDVPNLKQYIQEYWKGELILNSKNEPFSRTIGINNAVEQVDCDKVFICDSDMTLPSNFVRQATNKIDERKIWFPICFSMYKGYRERVISPKITGWWRKEGYGMMGILKSNFISVGKYDTNFSEWGAEDNNFLLRIKNGDFKIVRKRCKGLFHNYHPRDSEWHMNSRQYKHHKLKS